jgi:hypothetical protein
MGQPTILGSSGNKLSKFSSQGKFMKNHKRSFPRPVSVLVLTLTLMGSFAYLAPGNSLRAVAAQSGSYGFVVNAFQIDSNGANGGAVLGVINFDGAGNAAGTATLKPRDTNAQNAQPVPTTFTGTYSSNPDGTGSAKLAFDIGFGATFTMVTTDGGEGIQLLSTDCTPCGADVPLQLQGTSLSGALPMGLFFQGAMGNIPISLSNVTKSSGGPTSFVYAADLATGSGTALCPDGSTGTWTASVRTVTLAVNNGVGNFLASADGIVCGQADFETLSGLVTPTFGAGGAITLVLHGTGSVISGIARAVKAGGSLNGSYGFQLNYSPFPNGTVGVMKFDGAGNVAVSLTSVGGSSPRTATFTGTYSINSDGGGTINLTTASSPGALPQFAFVITDGGSQLLLLRMDSNASFGNAFGTARLQ